MTKKNRTFFNSFRCAANGVLFAARREPHIRVHFIIALIIVAGALIMGLSKPMEWAILLVIIAVVIVAEMLNTVIEILVKTLVPDHRPEVGQALDICAGAVLVAASLSVVIGVLLLGKPLVDFLNYLRYLVQ